MDYFLEITYMTTFIPFQTFTNNQFSIPDVFCYFSTVEISGTDHIIHVFDTNNMLNTKKKKKKVCICKICDMHSSHVQKKKKKKRNNHH